VTIVTEEYTPHSPRISHNGKAMAFDGNGRIYVHSLETGETRCVLDRHNAAFSFPSWSPDDAFLTFGGRGMIVKPGNLPCIYALELKSLACKRISDRPGVDRFTHWSFAGRYVAFRRDLNIGIIERNRKGVMVLPSIDGTQVINKYSWHPQDENLIVTVEKQEETALIRFSRCPAGREEQRLEIKNIEGACFFPDGASLLAVCTDRMVRLSYPELKERVVLPFDTVSSPRINMMGPCVSFGPSGDEIYFLGLDSRVYGWTIGQEPRVVIEAPAPDVPLPKFEKQEYRLTARDKRSIPVVRCIPEKANDKYVMFVQGGPYEPLDIDFPVNMRLLRAGYEVLMPAYRGTGGYGNEHKYANTFVCGKADVDDVVDCGLDWQKRFNKGKEKLALIGFSYGGFLSFLALTDPAAPWCCGISLWGVTSAPRYGFPEDEEERKKAVIERSPVKQAHRIRHPLLIMNGDRDSTPIKDLEKIQKKMSSTDIPCTLIIFKGDTHGLPLSREAMYKNMFEFLDEHFKDSNS
jgi:pimeloyl-ACP methyl ester carboxylesterase